MFTPTNDLLLRALHGERTERTPIWLMRQAGRTDPAYLKLREENPLPLELLFRHPGLAAQITLLPARFGVDALILYQDILTPLTPMGAHFRFAPGPVLDAPVDVTQLTLYDVSAELAFVGESLDRVQALQSDLPVLGFAGAPLTLLVFILQGGSFSTDAGTALDFLRLHGEAAHAALAKLTAQTISYLHYQAMHGVAAVQLFESAAYLLTHELYHEFALPYQRQIFTALKGVVPTINFARAWPHIEDLAEAGSDIVSLPADISIAEARAALGPKRVLQGNLDNHLLAHGPWDEVERRARQCIHEGQHTGHIFNLSHGLLKETPPERVAKLVQLVREMT